MIEDQPVQPANHVNIVAINQGKQPLTMDDPETCPLSPDDANALIDGGAIVIDTREPDEFGERHVPGAYNVQLDSPEFEQWVGWVTPQNATIILVLKDDRDIKRALYSLAFVGLDQRVEGYIKRSMQTWLDAGLPYNSLPQIGIDQLHSGLQDGIVNVLDVRESAEWDDGHIEKAHFMNFKQLQLHVDELELAPESHIAVTCAGGFRSSVGGSILLAKGFKHVFNVTEGMGGWMAAGLPVEGRRG